MVLGAIHNLAGRPFDAVSDLTFSLAIVRDLRGESHPEVAHRLFELGKAHRLLGNSQRASDYFHLASRIYLQHGCEADAAIALHWQGCDSPDS